MDINEIRRNLERVRKQIDAALGAVCDANPTLFNDMNGLKLGRCTFTHSGAFTFKLEGVFTGGKSKDEAVYELEREFRHPGLPPLGTVFTLKGTQYTVSGASSRGKIYAKTADGRTWTFKPDAVLRLTATAAQPKTTTAGATAG